MAAPSDMARALASNLAAAVQDVKPAKASMVTVGDKLAALVGQAVVSDIGDQSMSGWKAKGGAAIKLDGHASVPSDHEVQVDPGTTGGVNWRKGKGPMRVLEQGRQQYAAGDRRQSGTYTSKRTGLTTAKTRKVKRGTGATRGKGTWSNAVDLIQQAAPDAVFNTVGEEMAVRIMKAVSRGV